LTKARGYGGTGGGKRRRKKLRESYVRTRMGTCGKKNKVGKKKSREERRLTNRKGGPVDLFLRFQPSTEGGRIP